MKSILSNRTNLAIILVLATILYTFLASYQKTSKKYDTVSALSKAAIGISSFHEIAKRYSPDKIHLSKEAFLEKISPSEYSFILILSPKDDITLRETGILKDYVNDGGKLIISLVNKDELKSVKFLLNELKLPLTTFANSKFKDKTAEVVSGTSREGLLRSNENYAFYSGNKLEENQSGIESFYKAISIGKGHAYLILGIPPIANALLALNNNRDIAFRILDSPGKILIDEYRHFFTTKTLTDLFLDPSFSVPLLGMGMLVFIYLFFSDPHDIDNRNTISAKKDVEYHKLNTNLVLGLWKAKGLLKDALSQQGQKLIHKFPHRETNLVNAIKLVDSPKYTEEDILACSKELFMIHKQILEEKGIKG